MGSGINNKACSLLHKAYDVGNASHDVEKSLYFGRKTLRKLCFCLTKQVYVLVDIMEPTFSFKQLIFYFIKLMHAVK